MRIFLRIDAGEKTVACSYRQVAKRVACEGSGTRWHLDHSRGQLARSAASKRVSMIREHLRFFAVFLPLRSTRQHDHAEFFQRG